MISIGNVKLIEEVVDGITLGSLLLVKHEGLDEAVYIVHYVRNLYVRPEHRGRGVATRLLRKVMELVPKFCLTPQAWADMPMSTEHLTAWYERMGMWKNNGDPNDHVYLWSRTYQPGTDEVLEGREEAARQS